MPTVKGVGNMEDMQNNVCTFLLLISYCSHSGARRISEAALPFIATARREEKNEVIAKLHLNKTNTIENN